jgi:hypothetical protein
MTGERRMHFSVPVLAGVLLGCSDPVATECPGVSTPAIEVDVREAHTNTPAAKGTTGYVQDGAYVDSLVTGVWPDAVPDSATTMVAAFDRAGRYAVVLWKPGYYVWLASEIEVTVHRCGFANTVHLDAFLEPLR